MADLDITFLLPFLADNTFVKRESDGAITITNIITKNKVVIAAESPISIKFESTEEAGHD